MNIKKLFRYIAWFFICLAIVAIVLDFQISKLQFLKNPLSKPSFDTQTITIEFGDVLPNTFAKTDLAPSQQTIILKELAKIMNINHYKPNDFYEIRYLPHSKEWFSFSYYPANSSNFYSLRKSSSGAITATQETLQTRTVHKNISGTIESSLWEAMRAKGISPDVILEYADIFAWKIDFLTNTQKGDEFKIIYDEEILNKKNTVASIKIKVLQYKNAHQTISAIYFKSDDGKRAGYFDLEGNSVQTMFLSAPLQYRRISSYFSNARMHPILKYVRAHLGIDYAAPEGTPVSAIANGVVSKVDFEKNGYGNYVVIKHTNGYETSYGHLSKFGAGIKRGVSIKQGQVIGYVGHTGLATGPHLDFRIRQHGKPLNFLSIKLPPQSKLSPQDKEPFQKTISSFQLN
jgi:murein DD-endopeptidase MepM/ murein hydrolase activator NlpD